MWITTNCGTFLKRQEYQTTLTCLLRNLYAGQEVTELDMEQQTGSKLGKEYIKAVYCHPTYLTTYCRVKVKVKSLSQVQLFETPWTIAH